MFSPAQALRLAAPIPPIPMAAIFSLLLGACAPSTRLGTIAAESAAIAVVWANLRREMDPVALSFMRVTSAVAAT